MRDIRELLKNVSQIKGDIKNEEKDEGAVRILFVAPSLNSDGYYRMILPCLELSRVPGFETRVTAITKWDFTKTYTIEEDTISEQEIRWATYIIFPMLTGNYIYLFDAIRIINPNVSLLMDVNKQIHEIPKKHPDSRFYTKQDSDQLFKNILEMDGVMTPILKLYWFYIERAMEDINSIHVEFIWIPNCISKIHFNEVLSVKKLESTIVRIGIIGSVTSKDEYEYFLPVLTNIKETYKDKVEIIIFGWDGKEGTLARLLKEIGVSFHKSVSFLDYYQVLKDLNFDMVVLPMRPLKYYTFANTIKYLETSSLGIPMIAQEYSSFSEVIKHEETGLLAENLSQWESEIIRLIDNTNLRQKLGSNAQKWVLKRKFYDEEIIDMFRQMFVH